MTLRNISGDTPMEVARMNGKPVAISKAGMINHIKYSRTVNHLWFNSLQILTIRLFLIEHIHFYYTTAEVAHRKKHSIVNVLLAKCSSAHVGCNSALIKVHVST